MLGSGGHSPHIYTTSETRLKRHLGCHGPSARTLAPASVVTNGRRPRGRLHATPLAHALLHFSGRHSHMVLVRQRARNRPQQDPLVLPKSDRRWDTTTFCGERVRHEYPALHFPSHFHRKPQSSRQRTPHGLELQQGLRPSMPLPKSVLQQLEANPDDILMAHFRPLP